MKKILSTIISISMIAASAAVPVTADYTAPEESYDVELFTPLTFDDGTTTNSIDSTPAKQVTDREIVYKFNDGSVFAKEFYMAFDFRFDTQQDSAVNGTIAINKIKNNGTDDKIGPLFSYDGTNLRTASGSSSYQTICAIDADKWYTAEFEGKMQVVGASVTMRVYDENHEEVTSLDGLNLRQFYAGASNGVPNGIVAYNVSLDNLKFIEENPDELRLSSTADEINAGANAQFDYEAYRLDKLVTKHAVTWSVEGTGVEIDDTGKLIADISAPEQTATVTASATFGDKTLTGTKKIAIHAVDTGSEKFDTIVVSGNDTVKAGETASFTFTASKDGADVTENVTADDVVWSVYNTDDLAPNNNVNIKAENGTLTVADGVIPQTVYVHASSVSGNVTGSKAVAIGWSDNQKENVIYSNACETAMDNTTRVESIDGSTAYYTDDTTTFQFGNHGEYTLTEMDIKFGNVDGTLAGGFRFKRADGTENSSFVINSGSFSQQTGGSKFSVLYSGVEADIWYHMQILYSAGETGSINIYKYNEDGSMELVQTVKGINKRNSKDTGKIEVQGHTYIDNIKVTNPIADAVSVTSPGQFMFAGETAQYSVSATRAGMPLDGASGVTWSVLDADMLPIIDGSVTIDDTGLLTVDSMAPAQKVTVVASTATSSDKAEMNIQVAEIFSVSNIGINEAGDKIVKLYVDKNFFYNDDVVFAIAIKDDEGILKAVKTISTFGDRFALGSNELTTDLDVPDGFDAGTWSVEVMAWTNTEKIGGGSIVADAFTPVYDAATGIVTLNGIASSGDQQTLLVLTDDSSAKDENIAQIDQDGSVASFALPKGIENATYYIRIGGSDGNIQLATLTIGNGSPAATEAPAATEQPTSTEAPAKKGIVVDSFAPQGDSVETYTAVVTNKEDATVEVELIVAVYNDNNTLKSVRLEKKSIAPGATETITATNTDTEGGTIFAYLWNAKNNQPLADWI